MCYDHMALNDVIAVTLNYLCEKHSDVMDAMLLPREPTLPPAEQPTQAPVLT